MSDGLVIPRGRVRRRRLPRPPKFTPRQKMTLVLDVLMVAYGVLLVMGGEPVGFVMASAATAGIHGTFMDALHPPLGGLISTLLCVALLALTMALILVRMVSLA